MVFKYFPAVLIILFSGCTPARDGTRQLNRDHEQELLQAQEKLRSAFVQFDKEIVAGSLDSAITWLSGKATTPWEQFVVAEKLKWIDPVASFPLHEAAYHHIPNHPDVLLKYAIELHRQGDRSGALGIYQQIRRSYEYDMDVANQWSAVLSADCLLDAGQIRESFDEYSVFNRVGASGLIAKALYEVYGPRTQHRVRQERQRQLVNGTPEDAFQLIYGDLHWQESQAFDSIHHAFLKEDLRLVAQLAPSSELDAYVAVVKYGKLAADPAYVDSIKMILSQQKLLIDESRLFPFSAMNADVLHICLERKILGRDFLTRNRDELMRLALDQKDDRLLKLYVYWTEDPTHGNEEMAKAGWQVCGSSDFTVRYLSIKGKAPRLEVYDHTLSDVPFLSYSDPELNQALSQFPTSSGLHWLKANAAFHDQLPTDQHMVDAIRYEFRTLASGNQHTPHGLSMFYSVWYQMSKE